MEIDHKEVSSNTFESYVKRLFENLYVMISPPDIPIDNIFSLDTTNGNNRVKWACYDHGEWAFFTYYLTETMNQWLSTLSLEDHMMDPFQFYGRGDRKLSPKEAAGQIYNQTCERIRQHELAQLCGISADVVDLLTLTNYESEHAKGKLLFDDSKDASLVAQCAWKLDVTGRRVEFSADNIRMIRKLLASAGSNGLLFAKDNSTDRPICRGVIALDNDDPNSTFAAIQISIEGPHEWELSIHNGAVLRRTRTGFRLPAGQDEADKANNMRQRILDALKEEFSTSRAAANLMTHGTVLCDHIIAVGKQKHGASVIVADWDVGVCKKRLDSLAKHSKAMYVEFSLEDEKIVTDAAKMDGSIIINVHSGAIIALATIVDGLSRVSGDQSRGARFNALKNFTYDIAYPDTAPTEGQEVVSFVFSEDGGMNILAGKQLAKQEKNKGGI